MCLDYVEKTDFPPEQEQDGWRIVRTKSTFGNYIDEWGSVFVNVNSRYPFEQWVSDETYVWIDHKYESGFHFFKTLHEAHAFAESSITSPVEFCRVKAKQLTAKGTQHGLDCFVAKMIYVFHPKDENQSKDF